MKIEAADGGLSEVPLKAAGPTGAPPASSTT